MRAVLTRVVSASVYVNEQIVGSINEPGLLALVGISVDDGPKDVSTMVRKIAELRILRDDRSVTDSMAPILLVSQFTLMGRTDKGRRPSWSAAAPGQIARETFDQVADGLRARSLRVETGEFGADMAVMSVNDGPMTVLVET